MENQSNNWANQNKKNTLLLMFWTASWTLSVALATFGPRFIWKQDSTLTVISLVINLVLGVGMIFANKRYLDGLDELQRKIQLEATALALGVGLVGGMAYSISDITDLIGSDAEIPILIILMGLTYCAGAIVGRLRYL